jgi:hypothetical protein
MRISSGNGVGIRCGRHSEVDPGGFPAFLDDIAGLVSDVLLGSGYGEVGKSADSTLLSMADDQDTTSFTKRLSEIGVVAAVMVYFAGWTFISELFRAFGLSSHAIDIPVYAVFVYAYDALFGTVLGWLMIIAAVIALSWSAFLKPSRKSLAVYLLLAVFAFPVVHSVAKCAAVNRAAEIRSGHSYLATAVVRPGKTYPPDFVTVLAGNDLSVIATTKDMVYVVSQSSATFGGTLADGKTYILPLEDFAVSIRLKPAVKVR